MSKCRVVPKDEWFIYFTVSTLHVFVQTAIETRFQCEWEKVTQERREFWRCYSLQYIAKKLCKHMNFCTVSVAALRCSNNKKCTGTVRRLQKRRRGVPVPCTFLVPTTYSVLTVKSRSLNKKRLDFLSFEGHE